jgi:hypothetical protein
MDDNGKENDHTRPDGVARRVDGATNNEYQEAARQRTSGATADIDDRSAT